MKRSLGILLLAIVCPVVALHVAARSASRNDEMQKNLRDYFTYEKREALFFAGCGADERARNRPRRHAQQS